MLTITQDLTAIRAILRTPGLCGLDFETTVVDSAIAREVCTVQVTHENGLEAVAYIWPHGDEALRWVFDGCRADLIAHNAMFEMTCMGKAGVFLPVDCTMIAARVLTGTMEGDKGARTLWSLKALAERMLGKARDKTIRDRDWREPPDAEALEYCLDDTRDALAIWKLLLPMFDADREQWRGYRIVADSFPATVEAHLHGLPFDRDAHEELILALDMDLTDATAELDRLCAFSEANDVPRIANHGSGKQVAKWMRQVMLHGCSQEQIDSPVAFSMIYQRATGEHWPLTSTGEMSLDRSTVETRLKSLSKVSPDVALYLVKRLAWSKIAKLEQAFGKPLLNHVDPDGNVRATFRPHGAQTSRSASSGPNVQQIPTDPRFRRIFRAKPGRKLILADYSQVELRVGGLIAQDEAMIAVYIRREDVHQATATAIKRILTGDPEAVGTKQERKAAKAPNFAALYGAQAATIAINAGIPLHDAERMLDAWLSIYTGIATYRETVFAAAKKIGGVRLVSGQFIRLAPDTRAAQVINCPVQGSSASVMYLAKTLAHRGILAAREWGADIWYCADIHDEIILDSSEEDAPLACEILQEAMRDAFLILFPEGEIFGRDTLAEAAAGDSWADKE